MRRTSTRRHFSSMPLTSGSWPRGSRRRPWTISPTTTGVSESGAGIPSERSGRLASHVAGITFQNPIVLAAGTAAYGRELADVIRLDALGGIVTKAVSVAPRAGAAAPRVAEFDGGMINAIGLANPGVDSVRDEHLPWLASNLKRARTVVNVVGSTEGDFPEV